MISPYVLRHPATEARADRIHYFLRDYFHICQRQLPAAERSVLMDCDLIWDLEENTCFPVFLRQGKGCCDIVTDPLAPSKKTVYTNALFLNALDERHPITRAIAHVNPRLVRDESAETAKRVLSSARGWLELQNILNNRECPLIRTERKGSFGIDLPNGRRLLHPRYKSIVPFSLKMQDVELLICRKGEPLTNTVDVYDFNGNCIFRDIGDLFIRSERVLYKYDLEDGNIPDARFADEYCVVEYLPPSANGNTKFKTYNRKVDNLRLWPCADDDDGGPKRLHPYESEVRYVRNIETIDLREIHDVLYPFAERVGAFYDEKPEDVMLSIPYWNLYRMGHRFLDWLRPDQTPEFLFDISPECRAFFENAGLDTAQKIADADFSTIQVDDPSLEFEIFLWQMQIQYTLTHPAEADEEDE